MYKTLGFLYFFIFFLNLKHFIILLTFPTIEYKKLKRIESYDLPPHTNISSNNSYLETYECSNALTV